MGTFLVFQVLQACASKPGFSPNTFYNFLVLLLLGWDTCHCVCVEFAFSPSSLQGFWGKPGCQACVAKISTHWAISQDFPMF